jgi:serine/threonine protein kinase/Leucine-rich repeat (LRR) protein
MNQQANPPDPSLPVSELLAVHKVCQQFEAEWKAGRQPKVADYLGTTPEPQRSELERELEALAADYRRRAKKPTLEVFIQTLADSGLMTRAEVQAFLTTLPADKRPADAETLAREMFRQGKLTKFQAQAVFQGKTRGLVVGNYIVLDKLGQGGMGQVYKAQHRKMKRIVALKMLPSSATKSPDAVKRFQREVEAAAKLSHPNIVTAHDADEAHGVSFLVMEHVEGQDLTAIVKDRGPLALAQAVDCTLQAARGLEYAHRQGVVHRDIKPSNLLLDNSGVVKILDMGLARVEASVGRVDSGLTRDGQVMGTLDYMAPEQALDAHLADARSDIYSLGCTLHYLLTGRPPFAGKTVTQKIIAHREHPIPSLRALRPDVPEWLDGVFQKMLAKRPEDRQQTMSQVMAQLQQQALPQTGPAAPVRPSPGNVQETIDLKQGIVDTSSEQIDVRVPDSPLSCPGGGAGDEGGRSRRSLLASLKVPPRCYVAWTIAVGLFAVILFGALLTIINRNGTLVIESDDPNVQVAVKQGGELVEVVDARSGWKLSLKSGRYELAPQGSTDRFQLDQGSVTVRRGGTVTVKVTLKRASPISNPKSEISSSKPPIPNSQSSIPPPAVALLDGKTKITFRPELSMKPCGRGEEQGNLPPQLTDDPCGPFIEEPVYFDQRTGEDLIYDIQSDRPVEEVLFRGAGMQGMHMEALDSQGKILSQVGPIDRSSRWDVDTFFLLIPGGAATKFRLRVHNDAIQWLLIDTLRLRLRDTAGSTGSTAASPSPIRPTASVGHPQSPIPASFKRAEELQQTWAKRVGAAVQWSNSIGMKFALVPPGSFGGTDFEEPFYLGVYKVTQEEYQRVTGTNPSAYSATGSKSDEVAGQDTRRYPVENVCWIDAAEFCNRLSEKEGLKPYYRIEGDTVRLTGARSYCLPSFAATCLAAYAAEQAHGVVDASLAEAYSWAGWDNGPPHPVGTKKATAFGLYDMFGNGSENVGSPFWYRPSTSLQTLHARWAFAAGNWDGVNGVGPRGLWHHLGLRMMRVLDKQLAPALPGDGDDAAERAAAEWALGLGRGGRVNLGLDGYEWGIGNRDEFPQQRLRVARLDLSGVAIADADLDRLRGLTRLRELLCNSPQLGDAAMERLSKLPSLRVLNIDGTPCSDQAMPHIGQLKGLRALHLCGTKVTGDGLKYLAKLTSLEDLAITGTRFGDQGAEWLEQFPALMFLWANNTPCSDRAMPHIGQLKQLRRLVLSGTKVTGDGLKHLAKLTSLEELYLSGTRFSDQGAEWLEQFPALRVLDVSDTSCSDQALLHIGRLKHLRKLLLGGTKVTGDGLKHLAKLTSLEELGLPGTQFSDQGAEWLEQFPALRVLNVNGTQCSDQAMPHVGQLKHLRVLQLSGTKVTSVGLRHLANLSELEELHINPIPHFDSREAALAGLTRLRMLALSGTAVEDGQLEELPRWRGLKDLFLAGTSLTDAGLDTLANITTLENLDLGGTKVTAAGVARLQAALPKCKISGAPAPAKN